MRTKGAVVIDIGASACRAGFSGEDEPRAVFDPVVGTLIDPPIGGRKWAVAAKADCEPESIRLMVNKGVVENKDDYDMIFRHVFEKELKVDSTQRPVVISEPVHNTEGDRKNMVEVLFETFRVPALYIASAPALVLYNTCQTDGVILDIGDSFAQVASIYEWTPMPQTLMRTSVAGRAVTEFAQRSMKKTDYHFANESGFQLSKVMKESVGAVALDFDERMKDTDTIQFKVSEDSDITLGGERFRYSELLFQPKLDNVDCFGAAELIYESVMRSDIGLRKQLFANVMISGGTTLFTGFEERLEKELHRFAPNAEIKILPTANRTCGAWVGGSFLGCLELFGKMVVTREEYQESGMPAIQRIFFH